MCQCRRPGHPGWSIWPVDSKQFLRSVCGAEPSALQVRLRLHFGHLFISSVMSLMKMCFSILVVLFLGFAFMLKGLGCWIASSALPDC